MNEPRARRGPSQAWEDSAEVNFWCNFILFRNLMTLTHPI